MTRSDPTVEISLESVCGEAGRPPPLPSRSDPDFSGQLLSDRYRLIRMLGRGGMGAVYLARHLALDKLFAIKVLSARYATNAQAAHRFAREARATSRLHHENVVDVCDFGMSAGHVYLVMEYLEGEDLATILRRDGPMPWSRTVRILLQVCAALQAAHARRIIHRDIKPGNCIRLDGHDGDRIKVLDFGVAKVLGGFDDGPRIDTEAHIVVGTPEYMAPESFAHAPVDARVDIYAVGMLGYYLLTGTLPFDRTHPAFMREVCEGVRRPPSKVARGLKIPRIADAIVMQALRPDPAERYRTIVEFGAALAAAIEPTADACTRTGLESVLERPTAIITLAVPPPPTARWWHPVIVSVVALVLIGLALAPALRPEPPPTVSLEPAPLLRAEATLAAIAPDPPESEPSVLEPPPAPEPAPEPPTSPAERPSPSQRRVRRAPAAPPPTPAPEPLSPPKVPLWAPESSAPRPSDLFDPPSLPTLESPR